MNSPSNTEAREGLKMPSSQAIPKFIVKPKNNPSTENVEIIDDNDVSYRPKRKAIPAPRKSVKDMIKQYEDNIILPPLQLRDEYKPKNLYLYQGSDYLCKFDDTLFDTSSNDQPILKITEIRNTMNKRFGAYTNEFKNNVRKNAVNDKNDIFNVFEKIIEMTINKRQLKENDRLRIITYNNKLTNPISTKLSKLSC